MFKTSALFYTVRFISSQDLSGYILKRETACVSAKRNGEVEILLICK